jgi:HlyD family secretion protein
MGVRTTDETPAPRTEENTAAPPTANLPVTIAVPALRPQPRRQPWLLLGVLLLAIGAAGGGIYWWMHRTPILPPGLAAGNGRLEADEIDIATKFAGRIAEVLADEGDVVVAGQVIARMDTKDLEAALKKAQAQALQAQKALDEARANVEQQQTQLLLAKQQLDRTRFLAPKGFATKEQLDQRQQALDAANAGLTAAAARVAEAEHGLDAARQEVDRNRIDIADNALVAPRDGRIQYRLANIGEVLGAGGKVFTMLDTGYVYMDIFLPTAEAGRTVLGAEARIVLDAAPNTPLPAKVTFVSSQAQFTPKAVETRSERDKLMFRVRVRIDPERLRAHAAEVRAGLPGMAYIRLDNGTDWPASLQLQNGG